MLMIKDIIFAFECYGRHLTYMPKVSLFKIFQTGGSSSQFITQEPFRLYWSVVQRKKIAFSNGVY